MATSLEPVTVAQLITRLQQLDPSATVDAWGENDNDGGMLAVYDPTTHWSIILSGGKLTP